MTKPNPENERQKRAYFAFLREAHGRDGATVDRVAASLARFEASTRARSFKGFHREQAVAFKAKLSEAANARTGERLSKATVLSTLRDLRAFFLWLAQEPGYRSKIAFSDADYFNLSDKDVAIARAPRKADPPTPEHMRRVLEAMPTATLLERRDRALVAFACVTGARSSQRLFCSYVCKRASSSRSGCLCRSPAHPMYEAAVVLFGHRAAMLPALIRAEPHKPGDAQT